MRPFAFLLHPVVGCALVCGITSRAAVAQSNTQPDPPIIGRWNLTVQGVNGAYPSWLEVTLSGNRILVGRFMSGGGSARPISRVTYANGRMKFAIPPQWDRENTDLTVDASMNGDVLTGAVTTPAGVRQPFTAVRAPLLRRTAPVVWDAPRSLFNGRSLAGWTPIGGTNRWTAVNGELQNARAGANLVTVDKFTDFRLQVDVKYPKGGNSGIYLRGRYEVQVEDSGEQEPLSVHHGGIYGLLTPNENASKGPDVWQTFDITLIGRRVTVVLNGKTIIADQTIPGITGGALDSDESAPGPIYLQGDHGPVSYRNIIITPAKPGAR